MSPTPFSDARIPNGRAPGITFALLGRDPFIILSGVLAGVIGAVYATRPFPDEWMSRISDSGGSIAWMILFIAAVLHRLNRIGEPHEVGFWRALVLAWIGWLAGELVMMFGMIDPLSAAGGVSIDCIFFVYYLGWIYALEQRPHEGRSSAGDAVRRVGFIVRSIFAVGLFLYFVILPPIFLPENYLTWLPSYLFYVILDLYIAGRLAGAGLLTTSRRWRVIYSILAAGALFIALTDTLEALWVMDQIALPLATALDFLWYLPMFVCIVAARVKNLWPAEPEPVPDPDTAVRGVPVLAYSVAFPAIHLAMDLFGASPVQLERERTGLVLIWVLMLGFISVAQFMRISSRNRELLQSRREAEERIQFLLRHDELTGLPNRREIERHLQEAVERARRSGGTLAVLFVDLDDFKNVNDTWGHAEGDAVLKAVATRIRDCVRSVDRAGRFGGDEFIVVLEPVEHIEDAGHVADRILAAFARDWTIRDQPYELSASVGIAVFPRDGDTPSLLISRADEAMYRAKADGGSGSRSPADRRPSTPEIR